MSTTSAVVYFNRGTSCYVRLFTSIFSLRKHYRGPIQLLQEGPLAGEVRPLLERLEVEVRQLPERAEPILVRKASLWKYVPADDVMFLDSDTLIRGPVDEFFEWIRRSGFVASWFSGWVTTGPVMRSRIEEWSCVAPE